MRCSRRPQAAGDADVVAADIKDSLAQAQTEASALTTSEAESQGVEETAALVDEGLQSAGDPEESTPPAINDLVALKASRRQAYSLKIRTQEGDIVKISLRTSEFLRILEGTEGASGETSEAEPGQDIALSANARLNLRVYGDLNDCRIDTGTV